MLCCNLQFPDSAVNWIRIKTGIAERFHKIKNVGGRVIVTHQVLI